ncbi:hypothetical protein KPA94_23080 [Burkholderia semiarida]|uniref:hypothetical protein n=1 Tax=Burkholderia semiarida TaxID=2843303 RepID=UPI0023DDF22E|nr:hypothetical protein [Burkholderia semiarida]MDF3116318.1 hypothetical protein [Burkholderia semiarida]
MDRRSARIRRAVSGRPGGGVISLHSHHFTNEPSTHSRLPKVVENMSKRTLELFENMLYDREFEKMKEITERVLGNIVDIAEIDDSNGCPATSKASETYMAASKSPVVRPGQAVVLTYIPARCQHMAGR